MSRLVLNQNLRSPFVKIALKNEMIRAINRNAIATVTKIEKKVIVQYNITRDGGWGFGFGGFGMGYRDSRPEQEEIECADAVEAVGIFNALTNHELT